jgi:signal transduction histidine kinase
VACYSWRTQGAAVSKLPRSRHRSKTSASAPENNGWTDADGRPVEYPLVGDERVATPIESDGRTVAIILHDASLEEDPGLVGAVAAAARLAIDNERLSSALEAQLAEVRDSRVRIVEGADAERRRIERDLHDGSNQAISDQLAIAGKTVETHVNATFSKLGLEAAAEDNRRVLAVLSYLRNRMLTR